MAVEELVTQLKTVWKFDYEPKIKALRDLYEVAKKEQWNAATDIPWELEIEEGGDVLDPRQDMFRQLDVVKALPEEKQTDLAIHNAAWILSQFLHGEQGALLCCGQLVEAVPDIDGKLYAATQVIDEARHVEVFAKYIKRLDRVYPITPGLKALMNAVLQAEMWQQKCVGMQVVAESLAMGSFKGMQAGTNDELLRKIVELTAQDEARHVSYGLIYMKEELPKMSDKEREKVEDFAIAALGLLAGRRQDGGGMGALYEGLGIDLEAAREEMQAKVRDPDFGRRQPNTFQEYVIPQLERLGLITERTAPKYREMGLEVNV